MRKLVLIIVLTSIMLTGCNGITVVSRFAVDIYVDKETGVNYLVGVDGGITPRLTNEGELYINKEVIK